MLLQKKKNVAGLCWTIVSAIDQTNPPAFQQPVNYWANIHIVSLIFTSQSDKVYDVLLRSFLRPWLKQNLYPSVSWLLSRIGTAMQHLRMCLWSYFICHLLVSAQSYSVVLRWMKRSHGCKSVSLDLSGWIIKILQS